MWPSGDIEAVPIKFPVIWQIESLQSPDGFIIHRQDNMTQFREKMLELVSHSK
jgi:hypothetical protein